MDGLRFCWRRGVALCFSLLIPIALLGSSKASAFSWTNGDLVVAFAKNGFELILNLGPAPSGAAGVKIDATALTVPSQLGGTLAGAKWTALSVRAPDAVFANPELFGAPQSNIVLTTSGDPGAVSFGQVADAQAQLQPANRGTGWFALLRLVGAANGTSILENGASRLVIDSSLFASYGGNLGFGSDAVANTLPLSTAGVVGQDVIGSALPLYELLQDITLPELELRTQVVSLGSVRLVPEPGTALLVAAGLGVLLRRRRRTANTESHAREGAGMTETRLSPGAIAAIAVCVASALSLAAPAHAGPVSSNPDTDAFRTAGAASQNPVQIASITAQMQEITRVFRLCYAGGAITNDGSGCADGTNGRLTDFWVIQGILKNSLTDPNGFGVPNGPSLGEVTYRISGNGTPAAITCGRDPAAGAGAPSGVGYLAPEGFDGVPNTVDDAGGTGVFGVPGPGVNAGTSSMSAAPLVSCQGKTGLQNLQPIAGTLNTFLTGTNTELCVVNYDLNANGSVANDQLGAGAPGALTSVGSVASNESTNLRLSCDHSFVAVPPGDLLPPREGLRSQELYGGQIWKVVASRDVHAAGETDKKIHLNDPQIEALFGAPTNNSVCRLNHVGAASTTSSQNVTICSRPAGLAARDILRLSFMSNTAGSKVVSEDTSGSANGTVTTCVQPREAGGTQIAQKRVKSNPQLQDTVNCMATFSGSFAMLDIERFDPSYYAVVVEGVDADAAVLAPPGRTLKDLVKCGHYRVWGPVSDGVGGRNPGGSAFLTAHRAALRQRSVSENAIGFVSSGEIGFTKNATDGAYAIAYVPTSCPGYPAPPLSISASPTEAP